MATTTAINHGFAFGLHGCDDKVLLSADSSLGDLPGAGESLAMLMPVVASPELHLERRDG